MHIKDPVNIFNWDSSQRWQIVRRQTGSEETLLDLYNGCHLYPAMPFFLLKTHNHMFITKFQLLLLKELKI